MTWYANVPVDPRDVGAFARWVESRGDDMDEWQLLLTGQNESFGRVTIGDPHAASESAATYKRRGWFGIYYEKPRERKSSYVSREKVRVFGFGVAVVVPCGRCD